MAKDKYDEAVEYLTANPEFIKTAWGTALCDREDLDHADGLTEEQRKETYDKASCLFKNCGTSFSPGCLTQVAHDGRDIRFCRKAETPELTEAIRLDKDRIPEDGDSIEVKDLQVFAEWRRRIDKEIAEVKANG